MYDRVSTEAWLLPHDGLWHIKLWLIMAYEMSLGLIMVVPASSSAHVALRLK
jgi:hypothetical protein